MVLFTDRQSIIFIMMKRVSMIINNMAVRVDMKMPVSESIIIQEDNAE